MSVLLIIITHYSCAKCIKTIDIPCHCYLTNAAKYRANERWPSSHLSWLNAPTSRDSPFIMIYTNQQYVVPCYNQILSKTNITSIRKTASQALFRYPLRIHTICVVDHCPLPSLMVNTNFILPSNK